MTNKYLSHDETMEYIKKYRNGDIASRDIIAESNVRLVWSVVQRYNNRGYELEDLFQIGFIGLLKAIEKFDTSFDVRFSTYAVPMMMGEIQRFLRDDNWIKVGRGTKELAKKIRYFNQEFEAEYNRFPLLSEVAASLEVDRSKILYALDASKPSKSIHEVIFENDGETTTLEGQIEYVNQDFEYMMLHDMVERLEPRERDIINMRFFKDMKQADIGKTIGVSQVQVSRLEKSILAKLRQVSM